MSQSSSPDPQRRVFGIETEYGITCTLKGQRRLTPDEVARYLFRSVVAWGRSSNVFLENGGRLYLDVGSHPEFATPECISIREACVFEKAGELILHGLVEKAEARMRDEGIRGTIYLFKNNTDSAGNSYGCHENYLTRRATETTDYEAQFIPFLVSRQLVAGAGKVLTTSKGPVFCLSQRAEHIWEGVSSATTRSRPIINTRDEPHADAEVFRRLHVIVGDSNMSDHSNFLKVGSAAIVLRMLEHGGHSLRDLTLESPIRAIREISVDVTGRRPVRLASGREMSALDIQSHLVEEALAFRDAHGLPDEEAAALRLWEETLDDISTGNDRITRRIDWAIKRSLLTRYADNNSLALDAPRVQALDLQFHDIDPKRGIFNKMRNAGLVETLFTADETVSATHTAPVDTRAHLRGEFLRRAREAGRDVTVDWVHLKVNDQAQRTVACKDPFRSSDERVDKLIESL